MVVRNNRKVKCVIYFGQRNKQHKEIKSQIQYARSYTVTGRGYRDLFFFRLIFSTEFISIYYRYQYFGAPTLWVYRYALSCVLKMRRDLLKSPNNPKNISPGSCWLQYASLLTFVLKVSEHINRKISVFFKIRQSNSFLISVKIFWVFS
jgi:hypothetical protein